MPLRAWEEDGVLLARIRWWLARPALRHARAAAAREAARAWLSWEDRMRALLGAAWLSALGRRAQELGSAATVVDARLPPAASRCVRDISRGCELGLREAIAAHNVALTRPPPTTTPPDGQVWLGATCTARQAAAMALAWRAEHAGAAGVGLDALAGAAAEAARWVPLAQHGVFDTLPCRLPFAQACPAHNATRAMATAAWRLPRTAALRALGLPRNSASTTAAAAEAALGLAEEALAQAEAAHSALRAGVHARVREQRAVGATWIQACIELSGSRRRCLLAATAAGESPLVEHEPIALLLAAATASYDAHGGADTERRHHVLRVMVRSCMAARRRGIALRTPGLVLRAALACAKAQSALQQSPGWLATSALATACPAHGALAGCRRLLLAAAQSMRAECAQGAPCFSTGPPAAASVRHAAVRDVAAACRCRASVMLRLQHVEDVLVYVEARAAVEGVRQRRRGA